MATYTMRGQTYEFQQATNEEEANRLYWLMAKSSNSSHRRLAEKFFNMGIRVEVANSSSSTFAQMTTERFAEVSLIARQVLGRRGIQVSPNSVTFPAGTQKMVDQARDESLITYVLSDGATFQAFQGTLNFKRK